METEAKFVVADESTFSRLRAARAFGPYERGGDRVKQVHDRYLDTPDRRFYAQRWVARLRESGDGRLLTLKSFGAPPEGAVHAREEYEVAVPGLDPAAWPEGEVRRRAEAIAGDQPLRDLVAVDQTRDVSVLHDHGRAVAELNLDNVTIGAPDGPRQAYELEVELLPAGTTDDLDTLVQMLTDEYHLQPQRQSKFERALALAQVPLAPVAPPAPARGKKRAAGVLPTDSMAAAARKVVRVQAEALAANEAATRAGEDPGALHDMRVATRRMRAALRMADPYLQGKTYDRVRRGARDAAHALGAVRDLDVLIDHARQFRAGLPPDQQPDLDGLLAAWNADCDDARTRLVRLLDSADYAQFKTRLEKFIAQEDPEPDLAAPVEPFQVRHIVASSLWADYEAVRAFETVMEAPAVEQLHALRITGKYLRYALEFFAEVLPDDTRALIRDVTAMQDQLGALHDAAVAGDLIRDYLDRARGKRGAKRDGPETPPALAAYLADRQGAVTQIADSFGPTWATLTGPVWRARLGAVLAAV